MQGIHRKIEKAIQRLNTLRGKPYPAIGAYYYSDVVGNGLFSPRVYLCISNNGLCEAYEFSRKGGSYTSLLQRVENECAYLEANKVQS